MKDASKNTTYRYTTDHLSFIPFVQIVELAIIAGLLDLTCVWLNRYDVIEPFATVLVRIQAALAVLLVRDHLG